MHCFGGTVEDARRYLDLGFYISFAGNITFKSAAVLREVAAFVPLDRLLIETDAPFLAPQAYRGKRNEPAFVAETAKAVAAAKNITAAEVAAKTEANARALFGI